MHLIAGLIVKIAGMSLIKWAISLFKRKTHPQIPIKYKLFKRPDNTAIIQLTFLPDKKTVDITNLTAPGQKIQAAVVKRKVYEEENTVGVFFSYDPKASGEFTDAIAPNIHLVGKEEGGLSKQYYIALPMKPDLKEVTLELTTSQFRYPQKFKLNLETEGDTATS